MMVLFQLISEKINEEVMEYLVFCIGNSWNGHISTLYGYLVSIYTFNIIANKIIYSKLLCALYSSWVGEIKETNPFLKPQPGDS